MTTDLRAALREAAAMLESYSEIGFYSDAAKARAKVAEFRAIADAPPTVAELLPMVDAGHEVHWTCPGEPNAKMRATLERGAIRLWWTNDDTGWMRVNKFKPSDLTAPARLVEVTP